MRWRIKTLLLVTLLICSVLARINYVRNRYPTLRQAKAEIYYEWQQPQLVVAPVIGAHAISQKHSLQTQISTRSRFDRFLATIIGDEPSAVSFINKDLGKKQINELQNMKKLKYLIVPNVPDNIVLEMPGAEILRRPLY